MTRHERALWIIAVLALGFTSGWQWKTNATLAASIEEAREIVFEGGAMLRGCISDLRELARGRDI